MRLSLLALLLAASCMASGCLSSSGQCLDPEPSPRALPLVGSEPKGPVADEFSFLVGGHLYGHPFSSSPRPSPTLLAAIPSIRSGDDRFLVSVGDFVRRPDDRHLDATLESLATIGKPVFHVPGNHDYARRKYEERFGPGFGCFRYGNALFVLLNSEREPWRFDEAQIDLLRRAVSWARRQQDIQHVFCFAHKLVFAAASERYAWLAAHANNRDGLEGVTDFEGLQAACNFGTAVLPLLREIAAEKNLIWFGGDVGVAWSLSLFYDVDEESGITYAACGLGETRRDCLLRVRVNGDRAVLEAISLEQGATLDEGEPISGPVQDYGLDYWRRHFSGDS